MLTTSQMLCLDQANQIRCLSMSCGRYYPSRYLLDSPDFVCEFQARVLCQRQGRDIQVMQETASISALQRQAHSLLSYHAISILIWYPYDVHASSSHRIAFNCLTLCPIYTWAWSTQQLVDIKVRKSWRNCLSSHIITKYHQKHEGLISSYRVYSFPMLSSFHAAFATQQGPGARGDLRVWLQRAT